MKKQPFIILMSVIFVSGLFCLVVPLVPAVAQLNSEISLNSRISVNDETVDLVFSPDGYTIAIGMRGNKIDLWDARTGQRTATIQADIDVDEDPHGYIPRSIAFSPDGRTLAALANNNEKRQSNRLHLWDARTGGHIATTTTEGFFDLSFSPDGQTIVTGNSRWNPDAPETDILYFWDARTLRPIRTFRHKTGGAHYVKFSPDERTLVTVGTDEGNVNFWDARTLRLIGTLKQKLRQVQELAFSPDGRTLVVSHYKADNFEVDFWDVSTRQHIGTLQRGFTSFALSPVEDILAAPAGPGSIDFWDVSTRQHITTHKSSAFLWAWSLAFSPDGRTLAARVEEPNGRKAVYLWSVTIGGQKQPESVPRVSGIIPDPALRDAVEKALKKTPGAMITESDMRALKSLEADWAGIQDLTGLEFATNLTNVSLAHNLISDVSALTELKKLTALQLSYNQLSDISAFSGFKRLTELRLDGNGISDVSALAGLTKLKVLGLGRNQISDVSPLRRLKQLTWLYLSNNEISKVSPLAGLTKLRALYLSYNHIANFSPLAELVKKLNRYENGNQTLVGRNAPVSIPDPNLRTAIEMELGKPPGATITKANMQTLESFHIENTENIDVILDLTGIEFAENLQVLKINEYRILDISVLSDLRNLEILDLSRNGLSDISALSGLKNLRGLYLNDNGLSDISALSGLKNLTRLELWSNNISDISVLSDLRNLGILDLGSNELSDISALSGLKNLWELHLNSNGLSDISALSGLKNLTGLYLVNNELSDISALSGLKNLRTLYLWSNNISDISALSGLKNLMGLYLNDNRLSDISALSGLKNLRTLSLSYNRIVDFAPIAKVVENLDLYEKDPQLESLIPHSVRLSGPATVTSVVRDYTFTARVTNASNQGLGGIEVQLNGGETVRTGSSGEAKFDLNFPSVGTHDITVTVRDEETGTEFQKNFSNRVEMLKPYSVELLEDLRTVAVGNPYTAIFVVKSADGQVLEGFQVKLNVGQWEFVVVGHEDLPSNDRFPEFITRSTAVHIDDFDVWKWRVKSALSDPLDTDVSDSEGRARCSQRLHSTGTYAVSATVSLHGHHFLTASFSDLGTYSSDKKFFQMFGRMWYEQVTDGWLRVGKWEDPRPPLPSYRVKVIQPIIASCGTSAPSPEELDSIERLSPLFSNAPEPIPLFSLRDNGISEEKTLVQDETPRNTTTSFCLGVQWTPKLTLAIDVGAPVIKVKFLDGTNNQISWTKEAFMAWENAGAQVYFDFVEDSEDADIRVTFDEKKLTKPRGIAVGRSDVGATNVINFFNEMDVDKSKQTRTQRWWDNLGAALFDWGGYETYHTFVDRQYRTLRKEWQEDKTLWVSSELSEKEDFLSVALHEIGHAIGFCHVEHIPERTKTFGATRVEFGETSHVDKHSVMHESILLTGKIQPLSPGDGKAVNNVYSRRYNGINHVTGTISIDGVDHEHLWFDEPYSRKDLPIEFYVSEDDWHGESTLLQYFKWGGEIRVEVHIGIPKQNIIRAGVPGEYGLPEVPPDKHADSSAYIFAKVKLYEGDTEETTNLVDTSEVEFTVYNDKYAKKEIYVEKRGFLGGRDHATVTLRLTTGENVAAAPLSAASAGVANSDVNSDGQVDAEDLVLVSNYLGQPAPETPRVDVNNDGVVTIADLVHVAQYLGQSTYASAPVQVVIPAKLTYEIVEGWIDQARLEDDGSLVFRQGIAKLEYLLKLIIPEKMALLHNYPNPFNPETWIPYHLSEPTDVTLTIYAIDGKVVRHLDLGHQAAGYYQRKSRAAHWDGRNDVGERVASGIYFYTLIAGNFSATKKMLILK